MYVRLMAFAVLIPVSLAASRSLTGSSTVDDNKLVGTWKLVSGKYGGQAFEFPEGSTMLKHVTTSQFMWVTYDKDGKVFRGAGGRYAIQGDNYEESPEYGIGDDFEVVKGKPHSFRWKVDGNKWHHNGTLSNGLTIEEVWERVPAVQAAKN